MMGLDTNNTSGSRPSTMNHPHRQGDRYTRRTMARMDLLCVLLLGGSIRCVESSFVVRTPSSSVPASSAAGITTTPGFSSSLSLWQQDGGVSISSSSRNSAYSRRERVVCEAENNQRKKGVYARPSAAIERGSGFFVPGLEGSRVRLLFGVLVLILTYANQSTASSSSENTLLVSHVMATFYGILLLVQGSVEWAKEQGMGLLPTTTKDDATSSSTTKTPDSLVVDASTTSTTSTTTTTTTMTQYIGTKLSEDMVESMAWAAATYIALTPATDVMIVSRDQVLYRLGPPDSSSSEFNTNDDKDDMLETIHDILRKSRGGRVSLPSEHPVSTTFLSSANRRSVLLQRVMLSKNDDDDDNDNPKKDSLSILVGSSQLLASFTPNDLKW
eukprot:CAMPEP_0198306238 /NCGR_PEP_ID=MMETSP1449-20131203/58317_1 /TAXON_ID=420275 /ORGANISM="Attheya septentrionalis, Strain CCMP2084" /LENGTH=385 /DNA_ID=CAMNT_0044008787 /DNA_START=9 /DNA_END=1163 /DNA_ORIENTATION=+